MANYERSYRPEVGSGGGGKYTPRFIAYLIEKDSNITLRRDSYYGQLAMWCDSREEAELFADKNNRKVNYYPKEVYGRPRWIVGVPWRRMLDLLSVAYEDLCPAHRRLTQHLLFVGQVGRHRLSMARRQFSLLRRTGWASEAYLHGSVAEKELRLRNEHWHEAFVSLELVKKECKSQAWRRTGPKGVVPPSPPLAPKLVPLDLTVGEVLR